VPTIYPSARYEILLPLKYNDGSEVETEKFLETRQALVERFGAITIQPESVRGIWQYEGEHYEDESVRFILDVDDTPETEEFFRTFKESLRERFQQIDIWMVAYPIRII
jgi:hypothetical protein